MIFLFKSYLNVWLNSLFSSYIHIQITNLIILFIFIYLFISISSKHQPNGEILLFRYKIYNFKVNIFFIILYLLINFYLLIYLRSQYLTKEIDLKPLIQFTLKLLALQPFINSILMGLIFILLFFIIIIVFVKFHQFFIKEIKKRYLFHTSKTVNKGLIIFLYIKKYSLHQINDLFISWIIVPFLDYIKKFNIFLINQMIEPLYRFCQKFIKYLLFDFYSHFIIIYFFYELFYNNGILTTLFNRFLFVYIFYKIYVRCFDIGEKQCLLLNNMIYNMYYRFYSLKYVNLPQEWQNYIYDYIRNDLCENKTVKITNPIILNLQLLYTKYIFTTHDGIEYFNMEQTTFIEENNNAKDIVEGDKDSEDIAHYMRTIYPKKETKDK